MSDLGAPYKQGVDYFSFDTNVFNDQKVKRLIMQMGSKSFTVYIYLLSKIYGEKGYFTEFTKNTIVDVQTDLAMERSSFGLIAEVIRCCLRNDLFDQDIFAKWSILTCHGIQKRYIKAASKRKQIEIIKEYWLYDIAQERNYKPKIVIIPAINEPIDGFLFLEKAISQRRMERKENREILYNSVIKSINVGNNSINSVIKSNFSNKQENSSQDISNKDKLLNSNIKAINSNIKRLNSDIKAEKSDIVDIENKEAIFNDRNKRLNSDIKAQSKSKSKSINNNTTTDKFKLIEQENLETDNSISKNEKISLYRNYADDFYNYAVELMKKQEPGWTIGMISSNLYTVYFNAMETGHTPEDIKQAFANAANDEFHIKRNYRTLRIPSFFEKLNHWLLAGAPKQYVGKTNSISEVKDEKVVDYSYLSLYERRIKFFNEMVELPSDEQIKRKYENKFLSKEMTEKQAKNEGLWCLRTRKELLTTDEGKEICKIFQQAYDGN